MTVFSMFAAIANPADAANKTGVVLLNDAAADREIALGYRGVKFAEREVVSAQRFGTSI